MGEFSPTSRHGDCEEVANPPTAYGRRRRNWIDAHGDVPAGQVVDASCGNKLCIALKHACVRPRIEQPGKYRKIAARVHRLKVGQHFYVPGVGTDERSRNRFRTGLYAAARLDRVSVRGLPDGSVRVTKGGGVENAGSIIGLCSEHVSEWTGIWCQTEFGTKLGTIKEAKTMGKCRLSPTESLKFK